MKNLTLKHLYLLLAVLGLVFNTANAQQNVCKGNIENYKIQNPTSGSTYTWSVDVGGTIVPVTGTTSEINVNWDNSTGTSVLSVYETNSGGCTGNVTQLTVIRNNPPTASIVGNATLCEVNTGSQLTITLSGISPWTVVYTINGTTTTQSGINASPYIIPAAVLSTTTVYNLVTVTDSSCQTTATGSATLTVLPALGTLQIIHR
jgi:hypothetical protein